MPTQIPLSFRAAPLPMNFVGGVQEFADAFVARLSAEASNSVSFFASGTVAPTSNVGPWLKNNITWYVWSDALAAYVPEVIEYESLKYIASQTEPDQSKYTFWIKLDGTGKAVGIFYYSGGAWKDVYEDIFAAFTADHPTNAQMNTAIADAVGSQDRNAFSGRKLAIQTIVPDSGENDVTFGAEVYDTGDNYDPSTSTFTAPVDGIYSFKVSVLVSITSGPPASNEVGLNVVVNGSIRISKTEQWGTEEDFQTMVLTGDCQLSAGNECKVTMSFQTGGSDVIELSPDTPTTFFQGFLIQAL
jgi:hypothetical protein